ncbi:MAG: hypothetical protein RSB23_00830 [Alistipes sp.]
MQIVRIVMMTLAVAAMIYALHYMPSGVRMWCCVGLLSVGFLGLLYSYVQTRKKKQGTRIRRSTHGKLRV